MYRVTIRGFEGVQRFLNIDLTPLIRSVTRSVAEQVEREIKPYPKSTIANSPSNDSWYQRGYGPRWRTKAGEIRGYQTSEDLIHKWSSRPYHRTSYIIRNIASYSQYLHTKKRQVWWAGGRGWRVDEDIVAKVSAAGIAQRALQQALRAYRL